MIEWSEVDLAVPDAVRESRVEQLAREAKSLMIYAGSNKVQTTHVAKRLLTSGS